MYRLGDRAACIAGVKRKLHVFPVDFDFDQALAERIRGIQLVHGIPTTGVLDEETAQAAGVSSLVKDSYGTAQ
jgi:murein L,D-transpeptidase YcbB/YkuD